MRTRNNKLINFIFETSQILLVFLGVFSALMCMALGLELPINRLMCTVILLVVSILFYGLFTVLETFPKGKLYGILGISAFYGVLMIRFLGAVKKGLITIINSFLKQFMNYSGADLSLLAYNSNESATVLFCTTLVLILIGAYLIAIISAFFYRRRRSMVFIGLTLPFALIPLAAGKMGYFSNFYVYLSVLVTVIGTRHLRTDATDRRMRQKLSFILMSICLVAGLMAYLIMPPERYEGNEDRIVQLKNSVVSVVSWSPDEILSAVKAYFNADTMDYGRIGNKSEINYTGKTLIKLSGVVNSKHSLYLKGYVGDVYKNNRWTSLQKEEEYQKDLQKLKDNAVTLENWHVQLRNEIEKQTDALRATGQLRIRNIAFGYGNYLVPYLPTDSFTYQINGRSSVQNPGIDYTVEYYLNYMQKLRSGVVKGDYSGFGSHTVWENNEAERQNLKEFAEKYYLQIPDNLQSVCDDFEQFVKENYPNLKKGNPKRKDIIRAVKAYIMRDTEYSLSPGKTPSGEDTVEYFLMENKKGYCVYYATAAAILLRSYGVPARYVEGMCVSKEMLSENEGVEIEVPDKNTHAWVEVYDEKYGFVPVEVTPGYSDEVYSGDLSATPSSDGTGESTSDGNSDAGKEPDMAETTNEPDDDSASKEEPLEVTPTPGVTSVPQEDMIFEDIEREYGSDAGGLSESAKNVLMHIGKMIGVLILILAIFEAQRRIRRYIFRRNLKCMRMKKRIHMVHSHLSVLLSHKGVHYQGQTVGNYTKEISSAMEMPYDKIYDYVSLVFRASYGPDDITEEDMAVFRLTYENIRRKAYENASLPKKLYYMYIMVL